MALPATSKKSKYNSNAINVKTKVEADSLKIIVCILKIENSLPVLFQRINQTMQRNEIKNNIFFVKTFNIFVFTIFIYR
jgi:hypothetical protein